MKAKTLEGSAGDLCVYRALLKENQVSLALATGDQTPCGWGVTQYHVLNVSRSGETYSSKFSADLHGAMPLMDGVASSFFFLAERGLQASRLANQPSGSRVPRDKTPPGTKFKLRAALTLCLF